MARILVLYYSDAGHVEQMALAVAHGARTVEGSEVVIRRLAPLLDKDAPPADSPAAKIELVKLSELPSFDGIILGTPVHFGNMCAEVSWFLRQTEPLWIAGSLIGKVGAVFVSSSTQHGGHETAITSLHAAMLHHGMILVGLPYTEAGLINMAEISGGGAYGAGTISANDDLRQPSDVEFDLAEAQGRRVARIASRLYDVPDAEPAEPKA